MDQRSTLEKRLDTLIGPPLYYCADCLRAVKVTPIEDIGYSIKRPCDEQCSHEIIAPRKSILAGEGGLNFKDRVTQSWRQLAAKLTGRCV